MRVAWLLATDVERAVHHLSDEVGRFASGDLRPGESHFWEDELGHLASQVDHMAGSLGAMIVGVRATADGVESAAGRIGEASQRLLDTSREQVLGNDALRDSIVGVTGQVGGIRDSATELTVSVEFVQLVRTADVPAIHEDLGHGVAAAGALAHFLAALGRHHHVNLNEVDALVPKQPLGAVAVGAKRRRVDFNFRHRTLRP